jgi:hypothetical protein
MVHCKFTVISCDVCGFEKTIFLKVHLQREDLNPKVSEMVMKAVKMTVTMDLIST